MLARVGTGLNGLKSEDWEELPELQKKRAVLLLIVRRLSNFKTKEILATQPSSQNSHAWRPSNWRHKQSSKQRVQIRYRSALRVSLCSRLAGVGSRYEEGKSNSTGETTLGILLRSNLGLTSVQSVPNYNLRIIKLFLEQLSDPSTQSKVNLWRLHFLLCSAHTLLNSPTSWHKTEIPNWPNVSLSICCCPPSLPSSQMTKRGINPNTLVSCQSYCPFQ